MSGTSRQVLGISLEPVTMAETVERCVAWCREGVRPHVVMPVNAAIVTAMRHDRDLRSACEGADMRVADGAAVVWAARVLGKSLPERVAGIDLMQHLVERAAQEDLSIFLLGARPAVVERLVALYRERHPRLRIAGFRDGYFDRSRQDDLARSVRDSGADILFIGMPTPFKEVWAWQVRDELGARLILGVGGSFDVLAGFIARAPAWMQRAGLEWLWRLLCEPRRMWKRYLLSNTAFLWLVIVAYARQLSLRTAQKPASEKDKAT
jgi:N-acetylglucosaminyldiphosphoundecaprenol N-acetyl-beta-D-mannosaminyltransferase